MSRPQSYPRIDDDKNKFAGFLDEADLVPHHTRAAPDKLLEIIQDAVIYAGNKSSRAILENGDGLSIEELEAIYLKEGGELFKYFVKYPGDPASSAFDCLGKHFSDIAREQFHNRTLQKERMNAGWRYQHMAKDMSIESKRFVSVSDIGAAEADFNAVIKLLDSNKKPLSIYVSIKNRANTLGGQDWPKAIHALEQVADEDKNRAGPYICIFGIAMEHGVRFIKCKGKTKIPFSVNTEVWQSDFFWPFFTNYSYMEVIEAVVSALEDIGTESLPRFDYSNIPASLISSFGDACNSFKLLNTDGKFNDAHRLARLFVMGMSKFRKHDKS
ncbi:MAG: hypothetical protein ACR2IH_00915 [Pyrinomonadaceae bacterium]